MLRDSIMGLHKFLDVPLETQGNGYIFISGRSILSRLNKNLLQRGTENETNFDGAADRGPSGRGGLG